MSVVKPKISKRSYSVNLLLSDDENAFENDGYMEVLQKALRPNTKKSSRAASVPNRKKPKIITQQPSGNHLENSKSPTANMITQIDVFGLEKIPEEGSCSSADKVKESKPTRKSKSSFLKNTSKGIKDDHLINLQKDTKVKTPQKAKSVHCEPAATMSVVKTRRSKRSSHINLLLSDDEIDFENDSTMETKKSFTKKSSRAASVPNRKKPKIITQQPSSIDDSGHDLNESSIISDGSVASHISISPIEGNNAKHMLFTPTKYQTKVPMKSLNRETEDSSSDESTNSKPMTRSMIKKETVIPTYTPDRRVTRSQKLNLDNSIQSTSLIGHNQTEKDPAPKSGKKQTVKQKKTIN